MSLIQAQERETYAEVWGTLGADYDAWSPGVEYLPLFLSRLDGARGTLLDAGCGSGRAGAQLAAAGFDVLLCDLLEDGLDAAALPLPFVRSALWKDLLPLAYTFTAERPVPAFDYAYCCDVLEHVPEALTMLVVHQLCTVTKRELFLVVSHEHDRSGFWVGRPLHHTVKPFVWWRDHLAEVTEVLEARDLIHHGVFWLGGQGR